jgi:predicted  nucleic acid-binding Zn-ribbon protein
MKKLFLILGLTLYLTIASSSYAFETPHHIIGDRVATAGAKHLAGVTNTQNDANRVSDLKNRAQTEITRRLNYLNQLITELGSMKKLSSADKTSLTSQIQTQIDGLNSLQTKINADTDLTTLRADVKSVITNYYIFAFFRVQIDLLLAADRMSTTTDNFMAVYTKLQTRINAAGTQGKDVTQLNTWLSDMQVKLNDAKSQYQAAETELNGLTAQGYPGNKSSLLDARGKIKAGATDLKAAYIDAVSIRNGLGENVNTKINKEGIKNSTPSGKE